MVQFYMRKIMDGTIMLDDVPHLWRSQVEKLLRETQIKDEEENKR